MFKKNQSICIVGLGYVGLPLVIALAEQDFNVIGFDVNEKRVQSLNKGVDSTNEITQDRILSAQNLKITSNISKICNCRVYIITVPTPIDKFKVPDLSPIKSATKMIAKVLKKGDIVVLESTVYPGVTEEVCVPILENISNFKLGKDFEVGYSPERINPGDSVNTIENVVKVVSASSNNALDIIDNIYSSIVKVGTYRAASIKIAEAAKVIENTQRDINIALINEFYQLFSAMELDVHEILDAAKTKWNFLNFQPGLVGGHCIGVDPYYLLHKANSIEFHPELIHASRRVNDKMAKYVADKFLSLVRNSCNTEMSSYKILILGFTFKEDCPDIRNTKVTDFRKRLIEAGCTVDVYDPICDSDEVLKEYGFKLLSKPQNFDKYNGIAIMVAHNQFKIISQNIWKKLIEDGRVVFDFKRKILQTKKRIY